MDTLDLVNSLALVVIETPFFVLVMIPPSRPAKKRVERCSARRTPHREQSSELVLETMRGSSILLHRYGVNRFCPRNQIVLQDIAVPKKMPDGCVEFTRGSVREAAGNSECWGRSTCSVTIIDPA
jgi:hypothetical protein